MRQIETLMTRHENQPLSMLDETAVEEMFRFWRQRPFKKGSTKPISRNSAENYIGELKRFLRWLHKCKDFDWRKPENFDEIKTKVDAAPGDQQRKLVQVDTFSLDELRLLNEYATPLERVFLLLGLNCGFGVAEIASLLVGEVVLFKGHEERHQEILGYPTTNADSFIKRIRRKNSVYGEHILFPQTVEAMQWVLERRRKHPNFHAEAVLLLNDKGEAYNRPTKGDHRNQQIPEPLRRPSAANSAGPSRFSSPLIRETAEDRRRSHPTFRWRRNPCGFHVSRPAGCDRQLDRRLLESTVRKGVQGHSRSAGILAAGLRCCWCDPFCVTLHEVCLPFANTG